MRHRCDWQPVFVDGVPVVADEVVDVDVAVVGAGQAGLAAGYYLRRAGLEPGRGFVVLDAGDVPGGAWRHTWDSLRLLSPSEYSSLPGKPMPAWPDDDGFPPASHVAEYLTAFEERHDLRVVRPVRVGAVHREGPAPTSPLLVVTDGGTWRARVVISATGTWQRPFVPAYPGMGDFGGRQLHVTGYRRPEELIGQRVVVVGGGNSAAQVLAEVSAVAETTWVTARTPRFLPDDVDGRVLFAGAPDAGGVAGLGDIVMVPPVVLARERGALVPHPPFARLTRTGVTWPYGRHQPADAVLWCTGFRPALGHLAPLRLRGRDGQVPTDGTRAVCDPRVHLLGYGDWTGPASATLVGVGATACRAVEQITDYLEQTAGHRRAAGRRPSWTRWFQKETDQAGRRPR